MAHYPINDYEIERAKLQVKATILNIAKELEYTEFLQSVVAGYNGQLNKRFETAINKALGDKYGTYEYKYNNEPGTVSFGKPSEYDKTISNITAWLSGETFASERKYWKLGIHYKGTEVGRDYDAKKDILTARSQTLEFYSWENIEELAQQLTGKIKYLNIELEKVKDNQKHLSKYAREHNALIEKLNAYNDKISYTIADSYRIK